MRYLLVIALLAGCAGFAPIPESGFDRSITPIGAAEPPADWPKLVIQHVRIPFDDMISVCAKAWKNPSAPGRACALIVFKSSTCYIVDSIEFPMSPYVRRHEEQHCGGHDHAGETTIRDAWEKWKKSQ